MGAISGVAFLLVIIFGSVRGGHLCERPCLQNDNPMDCHYHFTVGIDYIKCVYEESEECQGKIALAINGHSPGPLISVCQNDTIIVDVKNALPSGMDVSFHWHGLLQKNTPYMDGVPMITQCPVYSGNTFKYRMRADRSGTFYYHAHSVRQQLDGLYGALIVRDGPVMNEKIMLIAPQVSKITSLQIDTYELNVSDLKVDVEYFGSDKDIERVRIINAAALDCPVSIVGDLSILSVDGNQIEPIGENDILLYPGERIDVLPSEISIIGRSFCNRFIVSKIGHVERRKGENRFKDISEYYKQFRSKSRIQLEKNVPRYYLSFDRTKYSYESMDFRYKLSEIMPYIPPYTDDVIHVYQFRNLSFLYPSSPLLTQRKDVEEDIICTEGSRSRRCGSNEYCECVQILDLPYNKSIDLVLVDEGNYGDTDQTLHLHGYTFHVLGMMSFMEPVTTDVIKSRIDLNLNLVNPIIKDTIVVPRKGYAVLRLKTDNPGYWLLESIPSKVKSVMGLEILLHVPHPKGDYAIPNGFPKCGNLKPQDVVFLDE